MDRLCRRGLKLNMEKSQFAFKELIFLGYSISEKGIRMTDARIKAIKEYPLPTDQKKLLSCLCLFNYFRRFINEFALLAAPLLKLVKLKGEFVIDDDYRRAFEALRNELTKPPVLIVYNPDRETELHTDASSKGYGACLLQKKEGAFHPVAFYSKKTTKEEARYHSFELETLAVIKALRHFRVYLQGIPFRIVTDCSSLTLTLKKKQVNCRIARWAMELENYNYSIIHRHGACMQHVDALSRCDPIAMITAGLWLKDKEINCDCDGECEFIAAIDPADVEDRLGIAQSRDSVVLRLRDRLENEHIAGYDLIDGLVFRTTKDQTNLLYVPKEMEENVIRMAHDSVGHQGVEKTRRFLLRNYWMPELIPKIERHIHNCLQCITYSCPAGASRRSLHMIPKEPVPFDTVHIDHFGPLPAVQSKRKHILAVVDGFTKYTKLYPVNSTSSTEVICSLKKYFEYYSRPRRIVSDRGSCFTSSEFEEFLLRNNINHVRVATAAPQANGQVERTNRVLKAMLGKLSDPVNHADWVSILPHAEFAINNTRHATTNRTPSELLFGIMQRGAVVDPLTEYLEDKQKRPVRDLEETRSAADRHIKEAQELTAVRHADKYKPGKTYEVGDYVVIRNVDNTPGTNKKFLPTFRGPYRIFKVLGNDRYVIRDVENCQRTQIPYDGVLDASRLKKWVDAEVIDSEVPLDCLLTTRSSVDTGITSPGDRTDQTEQPKDDPDTKDDLNQVTTSNHPGRGWGKQSDSGASKQPAPPAAKRALRPLPHRTSPQRT